MKYILLGAALAATSALAATMPIRKDLGNESENCVFWIDSTAVIEALRKRLKEISRGSYQWGTSKNILL